ncbi:glyoxalase III HchA [Pseudomonas fulva]|uniref:glyoxalase III HchA n=1 Tax=Pseudomonas fulva TaxID=47880 RepID=UPI003D00F2BE
MSNEAQTSKSPRPDAAENNAFFPSDYSLEKFTSTKSDLSDAEYPTPYRGSKKILMIGADERYLLTDNGSFFSTGNHPVETLLPMYHLDAAGFAFDVATVSGNPVKFEFWAMPREDQTVGEFFNKYHAQFKQPQRLSDVLAAGLDSYAAIFVPGGHGALIGIPDSTEVGDVLKWAAEHERFVISLCHGPAAFLAVGDSDMYRGYRICAFPDALDATTPQIGYMPGHLTWKFGERLKSLGFEIVNEDITGAVHRDRTLITGDSPLAGNNLGKLAAEILLKEVSE